MFYSDVYSYAVYTVHYPLKTVVLRAYLLTYLLIFKYQILCLCNKNVSTSEVRSPISYRCSAVGFNCMHGGFSSVPDPLAQSYNELWTHLKILNTSWPPWQPKTEPTQQRRKKISCQRHTTWSIVFCMSLYCLMRCTRGHRLCRI